MAPAAPLQALYLEVVPVIGINQEVNLTAVLLPLNPNLTVFYWWIGHSLQVRRPGPLEAPPPHRLPSGVEPGADPTLRTRQDGACGTMEVRRAHTSPPSTLHSCLGSGCV